MARSGASGIAGNKETVRTERGAEAAPQRCRGERASPYSGPRQLAWRKARAC
jgi:hypothetical protein